MKKRLLAALMAGLLVLTIPVPSFRATVSAEEVSPGISFYVSVNGSDSNAGTLNAPFKSLEKARDTIRTLKAEEGLPEGGVTVYLREGRYERTSSFELREQDSGEADKPITYTAYPGESVILSGSEKLEKSAFVPVTDSSVLSRIISPEARTKVLEADLAGLGITDYGELSRHGYYLANDLSKVPPMELYVAGEGMTLARWPNEGTVQMDEILDPDPQGPERGGAYTRRYLHLYV
ncbi:hypothetical protein [Paenibacillus piscarius]|uniref:hypothetical protein n=1 Tax=Paenibacillus piscarius TaxID=1089681 RepID=UPI001EE7FA98|nr:hypothetical protein [Paenibacillus piscarius]